MVDRQPPVRKRPIAAVDQSTADDQRPKTRIYAAGCNAWGSLSLNQEDHTPGEGEGGPTDIHDFKLVRQCDSVSSLQVFLSWTTCLLDGQRHTFGAPPSEEDRFILGRTAQNAKGQILGTIPDGQQVLELWSSLQDLKCRNFEFRTLLNPQSARHAGRGCIKQIGAWDTGFIMMDESKRVYTMGDPRFAQCLGRDVQDDQPADVPFRVTDLPDSFDEIKKIAAGGYAVAALTTSGHLYAWGMQQPGSASQGKATMPGLSEMPNYQPIGDDEDIEDVALGDTHAIALTKKGDVYVIGDNRNGQLGLGDEQQGADTWIKVELEDVLGEYQIDKVVAGPKSSFLIARLRDNGTGVDGK